MKTLYEILIVLLLPFISFCQLTEDQISFNQNTDNDSEINVIDTDDDNDAVLDNDDFLPLNANYSGPIFLDSIYKTHADAGLRSNTNANANKNYGSDQNVQLKNNQRSFIMKFVVPDLDFNSATLTIYTETENDSLAIFYVPDTTWQENTITANNANLTDNVLLGYTGLPVNGEYNFSVPVSYFPQNGGSITIWLYDTDDTSNEDVYTKEYVGDLPDDVVGELSPRMTYSYTIPLEDRLVFDVLNDQSNYMPDGTIKVGVKLAQSPSDDVYLPFSISDTSTATIEGDQVLTFNSSNWNTIDTLFIKPEELGDFDIYVRPLHSIDAFYNGYNPADLLDYLIQPVDLPTLGPWTVTTGNTLVQQLSPISSSGSVTFDFSIIEGPSGLSASEITGEVTFTPVNSQIGVHDVVIEIIDESGYSSRFYTTLTVIDGSVMDLDGIYVDMNALETPMTDGSAEHPFVDISTGITQAVANKDTFVFIRGGEYTLTSFETISDSASVDFPIVIKPFNGEKVKINFGLRNAFNLTASSENLTFEGFEIDGGTDAVEFWCIVAQALYGDDSIPRGGGIAFNIDGENINIYNNYIHDCYQKAVEIKGRYINIKGNIIHSIATTSLSGGHGIMRQQKGREFLDDDILGKYRWDINENMLFNVEQRIYSWVPGKGFMEMTLDEGKPILIDDPKDENGMQEYMSARIRNNVVAYGSIDGIRLKSTPNLEVSNNSVFSESTHADGFSDKKGDTDTPQFTNFIGTNNVAHTNPATISIEFDHCIDQTIAAGGTPIVYNNIGAGGSLNPNNNPGLIFNPTNQLFTDPLGGDFSLNPVLNLGDTVGVLPAVLTDLNNRANDYGVEIKWDRWYNDELKLTQVILDNIPGINDGVTGNETVFTDYGDLDSTVIADKDRRVLKFDIVVGGDWHQEIALPNEPPPDTMEFRLNPEYAEWYQEVDIHHKNNMGDSYDRIKWGESIYKQDKVFQEDWLLVSQITSDSTNTTIEALENIVSLNGDLLIDFEGYVASPGECFDLILADSINSQNSIDVFDRVLFEGDTLDAYELTIENRPGQLQALQLKVLGDCNYVLNSNDLGEGSLRAAIDCAMEGDTVFIPASLANDTIKLTSTKLLIDKNITILADGPSVYLQNCLSSDLEVNTGKIVTLENFTVLSDLFTNKGELTCKNMTFKNKSSNGDVIFDNQLGSNLSIVNEVMIE